MGDGDLESGNRGDENKGWPLKVGSGGMPVGDWDVRGEAWRWQRVTC
jgi:hypothetical protein